MKIENKITAGIVLFTLIIVVGGIWVFGKDKNNKPLMGEHIADMGSVHIAQGESHPAYNSNPPTSGWHWSSVAGPGIKDEPVPDELILHSMEHGAAVVWYKEGLDTNDINKIKEAFNSSSGKKIMLPRKDLDVPVALTSWSYLLKLDSIDVGVIKEFIETNNDRAPEKEPI